MSNVQLSNVTLDRLAARRTFPFHARTGVCKNLFGPVDHEELSRDLKKRLQEISEMDRRRWSFDFDTETPLEGGEYEWEEVDATSMPAFYAEAVHIGNNKLSVPVRSRLGMDSAPKDCNQESTPNQESRLSALESTSCGDKKETNQEKRSDKLNSGNKANKTLPCTPRKRVSNTASLITDFYMKRKKTGESKVSSENGSPSEYVIPTEQTPCKRIR
ncbi:cyclin-dependent kinase inhibitor 1B [Latimeria chalumnae]|uniref:Cyclin dependent kinase inhibitor 1C n=1 Tax=Latimeria chalumnae TaxID=7897 RepID=H3B1F3_LATCH|nr:PREDICTED: cyclin-dependent kinase inhibitor 1C [Latimeria chalumnae]|eukprot:XP_005997637.1 PREDICTED: cyclin-dependent kinase inhibitor 1C [Latimeria chalumnae]